MQKHEKTLLTFDLSSITVGIGLFSLEHKKLIKLFYWKYKSETMLEKALELEIYIEELCKQYNIKYFCIEESLKSFQSGGTNAEAMLKTTCLNFICQYFFKKQHIEIKELNVMTARKLAYEGFHSIARKIKGKKQKEVAFDFVINELGPEIFPTKIMKSGKRKGEVVFLDEATDMSDAYVLGKAALKVFNFKVYE